MIVVSTHTISFVKCASVLGYHLVERELFVLFYYCIET